jgi:maltose/moltooligosaccharide transporter
LTPSGQKIDTKFLLLLGAPSLGLAFAITILTTFLPSVLSNLASPLAIGLILGGEGIFGATLPIILGSMSDRARNVTERFRYLVPAITLMMVGLTFVAAFNTLWFIAVMVVFFYLGYYAYLAPYWAIYPDLIPKSLSGRSRSAETLWQVIGSFLALVSGGFLIGLWQGLPFVTAAALMGGVTIILWFTIQAHEQIKVKHDHKTHKEAFAYVFRILKNNHDIRNLSIANALWNASLQTIRTFVVLFFVVGLHKSNEFVSGVAFPIAAIGLLVMAPLSGKIADTYGHIRTLKIAVAIYGVGAIVPWLTQDYWVVAIVPFVAGAAATVMTLPYAALMRLLNGESHGSASGIFGFSRAVGAFLGPLITGAAIVIERPHLPSTSGYAVMWLMVAIFNLSSLFFLRNIRAKA